MIELLKQEKATDDSPVDLIIRDRNGEAYTVQSGAPVVWKIVGEFSSQYRANERKITDKILKAARRGEDFDGEESEQVTLERLAGGVIGWNTEDVNGNPVPCNVKNVAAVLAAGPWIVPQVTRVVRAHASFFDKSSSDSASS